MPLSGVAVTLFRYSRLTASLLLVLAASNALYDSPVHRLMLLSSANAAPPARATASVTATVVSLLMIVPSCRIPGVRVRRTISTLPISRRCRAGPLRLQEAEDSTRYAPSDAARRAASALGARTRTCLLDHP